MYGTCPDCGLVHSFPVPGDLRALGTTVALGGAVLSRRGGLPLLLAVLTVLVGDEVELWLRARCPECGVLLRLIRLAN